MTPTPTPTSHDYFARTTPAFLAWTTAPPDYDYHWYVTRTGATHTDEYQTRWYQVKVTDRARWERFQTPRYGSGGHVAALDDGNGRPVAR